MNLEEAYLRLGDLTKIPLETLEEMARIFEDEEDDKHIQQHALKILINALYGAMANKYFLLANPDLAAAITSTGRFFIRLISVRIEERLQQIQPSPKPYVIYNDTDAVYYQIEPIMERKFPGRLEECTEEMVEWADAFEKKVIQKIIQDAIAEFAQLLNTYDPSQIGVEREVIADAAVFVAKKKYFARVRDMEGVRFDMDDPYLKVMGLEIARGGTPPWCKKHLKDSISIILDKDAQGVREWRDKVKKEFLEQPIEDISMTLGISSLNFDIGDKGIPQGARSALSHNRYLRDNDLLGVIEEIKPGEKYKRCYLKTPNRFGTEILSFEDPKIIKMIEEDGIYDYATNFEKYFENPLENMVGKLGFDISDNPHFSEW